MTNFLPSLSRNFFFCKFSSPYASLHKLCQRKFSDKSNKDSETKNTDFYTSDEDKERIEKLFKEYSERQHIFKTQDKPPEYTGTQYGLKRAMTEMKKEAKKTWRKIQDPGNRYQEDSLFPSAVDVLVIGGGAVGTSIALQLSERGKSGCRVALLDKDFTTSFDIPEYSRAGTNLAVGGLHQQYSLPENIEMSLYGAEYLRNIKHHCFLLGEEEQVSDVQFTPNNYLFCANEENAAMMEENFALQKSLGVKNVLLTPSQLKERFPWLNTDGIAVGSLGLDREGWFDPSLYLNAIKRRANNIGVELVRGEAVNFIRRKNVITHVESYDEGAYEAVNECVVRDHNGELKSIQFAHCVIAGGMSSQNIASLLKIGDRNQSQGMLFVPIPVEPRKRYVYCIETPNGPGVNTPQVIDTSGTYFRREGLGNYYICGKTPTSEEEPSIDNDQVDYNYFNEKIKPHLINRVKGFEQLEMSNGWSGFIDYNYYDQNPLLGAHPGYFNIHFATGFGHLGVQVAPAVGKAITELIIDGYFRTMDLSRFLFRRMISGEEIKEKCKI